MSAQNTQSAAPMAGGDGSAERKNERAAARPASERLRAIAASALSEGRTIAEQEAALAEAAALIEEWPSGLEANKLAEPEEWGAALGALEAINRRQLAGDEQAERAWIAAMSGGEAFWAGAALALSLNREATLRNAGPEIWARLVGAMKPLFEKGLVDLATAEDEVFKRAKACARRNGPDFKRLRALKAEYPSLPLWSDLTKTRWLVEAVSSRRNGASLLPTPEADAEAAKRELDELEAIGLAPPEIWREVCALSARAASRSDPGPRTLFRAKEALRRAPVDDPEEAKEWRRMAAEARKSGKGEWAEAFEKKELDIMKAAARREADAIASGLPEASEGGNSEKGEPGGKAPAARVGARATPRI
jgi:hypothetical protein